METRRPLHLLLVFLSSPWLLLLLLLLLVVQGMSSLQFTRDDFPHDFAFGAGTSAYQVIRVCMYRRDDSEFSLNFLPDSELQRTGLTCMHVYVSFGWSFWILQYEGGAAEDGRTPSIWDTYTHSGMAYEHSQ